MADLEALAAKFGGTDSGGIDYEALASKFGAQDAAYDPTSGMSGFDKFAAGAGKAVADMGRGAGQVLGLVSQQDIDEAKARDAALMDTGAAKFGNFAGNVAMLAPTAAIPGAATVGGAATIGALQGALLTPGGLVERAKAALFGAGGGAAGAKAGQYLSGRLADQTTEAAANASSNSVRDATLKAGQEAGYAVPPSTVNPSFLNGRLESLAGKAALNQQTGIGNQEVSNALARQALGIAPNSALSESAVEGVIKGARSPYQQVAALPGEAPVQVGTHFDYLGDTIPKMGPIPPTPADALEALKQARFDTNAYFKHYSRSADPSSLAAAKAAKSEADVWELFLQNAAERNGSPALMESLRQARQIMAKGYTVDRALNTSTGNIVAGDIGKLEAKGAPLTGELSTMGRFADAFPQFVREGSKIPTPGVSKLEHVAAVGLAALGGASTGGPGAVIGLLPYVAPPVARKILLSKWYQQLMAQPNYSASFTARAGGAVAPYVPATGMSLADLAR